MVFTETCRHCKRPWTFHDDDKPPFHCDYCAGLYAEILVARDIIEGRLKIRPEDNSQDEDEE